MTFCAMLQLSCVSSQHKLFTGIGMGLIKPRGHQGTWYIQGSQIGWGMDGPMYMVLLPFNFYAPKELWEAYSNRTVRPSVPLRVRCISPIFFEVGIPNLVCGCILGWRSVAYHFWVTVTLTLTSDLVFTVITMSVRPSVRPSRFVSGAYLLYSFR